MKNVSLTGTAFVFVHGAWHSSGQWAATRRALAGLGAASVAVDMPGHGFDAPLPSDCLGSPENASAPLSPDPAHLDALRETHCRITAARVGVHGHRVLSSDRLLWTRSPPKWAPAAKGPSARNIRRLLVTHGFSG
ncbi:alpha/beta fold hydrolase [Amycolatopsis acidicola]|uniref:alpha/beta fold hydrolase n=1 Tax=Amycolatopsis acidicola TaxID=2596893 RepID=UPI001AA07A83|nr:alpha/beta fold hydrolase [Amycolatopsis acidicola]